VRPPVASWVITHVYSTPSSEFVGFERVMFPVIGPTWKFRPFEQSVATVPVTVAFVMYGSAALVTDTTNHEFVSRRNIRRTSIAPSHVDGSCTVLVLIEPPPDTVHDSAVHPPEEKMTSSGRVCVRSVGSVIVAVAIVAPAEVV
jgi:hypothetical protein